MLKNSKSKNKSRESKWKKYFITYISVIIALLFFQCNKEQSLKENIAETPTIKQSNTSDMLYSKREDCEYFYYSIIMNDFYNNNNDTVIKQTINYCYPDNSNNYIVFLTDNKIITYPVFDVSVYTFIDIDESYFVFKNYAGNDLENWDIFSIKNKTRDIFNNGIACDLKSKTIIQTHCEFENIVVNELFGKENVCVPHLFVYNFETKELIQKIRLSEFAGKYPFIPSYIDTSFIQNNQLNIVWNKNVDLGGLDEIENYKNKETTIFRLK